MDISEEEVKIRRMTEADLPGLREIDPLLIGEGRALSWPLRAETQWAVYRPALSFVAELGDETVGFLLGDIRGAEYGTDINGWIDMMGIAPAHQRRGIGRRLVEAFCEECRRNEVKTNVIIREDDEQLTGFFISMGFRRGKLVSFER
jgi:ribosomal protein S18 acetylase RimI-like enzyme